MTDLTNLSNPGPIKTYSEEYWANRQNQGRCKAHRKNGHRCNKPALAAAVGCRRPLSRPSLNEVTFNRYSRNFSALERKRKKHRELIGGMWETIGRLQFDFMVAQGLIPSSTLLDIGCGALRGGCISWTTSMTGTTTASTSTRVC
jgi:hypothetical protein